MRREKSELSKLVSTAGAAKNSPGKVRFVPLRAAVVQVPYVNVAVRSAACLWARRTMWLRGAAALSHSLPGVAAARRSKKVL